MKSYGINTVRIPVSNLLLIVLKNRTQQTLAWLLDRGATSESLIGILPPWRNQTAREYFFSITDVLLIIAISNEGWLSWNQRGFLLSLITMRFLEFKPQTNNLPAGLFRIPIGDYFIYWVLMSKGARATSNSMYVLWWPQFGGSS